MEGGRDGLGEVIVVKYPKSLNTRSEEDENNGGIGAKLST
jgi:hypothetical protein